MQLSAACAGAELITRVDNYVIPDAYCLSDMDFPPRLIELTTSHVTTVNWKFDL
jgi:hypothetical protein